MTLALLDGRAFDLPGEFDFSIIRSNPFFSEEGEFSLPAQLPKTKENSRLFAYADTPGGMTLRPPMDIVLEDGVFSLEGRLRLLSADADGYDVVLLFNEGMLYNRLKGVMLTDLMDKHHRSFVSVGNACDLMHARLVSSEDELVTFPILCQDVVLNEVTPDGVMAASRDRRIRIGNEEVNIPAGFLLSPFLRLRWVVAEVFSYVGYTVVDWGILDRPGYRSLVLLNNTLDALAGGKLYYSHLVPDVSAGDLLKVLGDKFASRWVVHSDRTVSFLSYDRYRGNEEVIDLSDYVEGPPRVSYPEQLRFLQLSSATFVAPYYGGGEYDNSKFSRPESLADLPAEDGTTAYDDTTGLYWKTSMKGATQQIGAVSTINTSYSPDAPEGFSPFSLSVGDTVPCLQPAAEAHRLPLYNGGLLQVGKGRWLNSFLRLASGEEKSYKAEKMPIMLALNASRGAYSSGELKTPEASLLYNGSDGLFEQCYRGLDTDIRNAHLPISYTIDLPAHLKVSLSGVSRVVIHGEECLISGVEYSTKSHSQGEIKLLTTRPLGRNSAPRIAPPTPRNRYAYLLVAKDVRHVSPLKSYAGYSAPTTITPGEAITIPELIRWAQEQDPHKIASNLLQQLRSWSEAQSREMLSCPTEEEYNRGVCKLLRSIPLWYNAVTAIFVLPVSFYLRPVRVQELVSSPSWLWRG